MSHVSTLQLCRRAGVALLIALVAAPVARAQMPAPTADSTTQTPSLSPRYWQYFGLGFATSLALHEAAHVMTSVALGAKPSFGFSDGRPTIYSGLSGSVQQHKQFLFSAAGLTMQTFIDEAILDIPHARGSAFERGVLGGGIATTLFYLTIGRTGSVSDVQVMAEMHGMTKTQTTLLFGSIVTLHMIRISRDHAYANFFARPGGDGGMDVGVSLGAP